MGNRTVEHKSHEHNVPNSFMCSAPGHEFWDYCLRVVVERSALANAFPHAKRWDSIERIAGPAMLYVALMDWRYITGEHLPIIDDAALIYPYDWTHAWSTSATPMVEDCHASDNPKFNPEKCKARFPDAYAITYWSRTWADDAPGEPPPQETAPVSNAVETADGD
ncbi:hypothetical protein WJX84_008179 [Apatococcus fuscideae]|uniref:Uncharacterized protein n=1 Tax=Apatococcus fuscideae TaxID=2026836 RepID=A0AAW1S0K5_9CHLO